MPGVVDFVASPSLRLSRSSMRFALSLLIATTGLLFAGCGQKDSSGSATNASSGNPVTAPVDYLGAAAKAKKLADKTVSGAGLNQAIQLYQAQEGQLPKTLNDLVTKQYLHSIPPPPAGMKYDYNPQTGALRVVPQ
jgi:hypothetical protein